MGLNVTTEVEGENFWEHLCTSSGPLLYFKIVGY